MAKEYTVKTLQNDGKHDQIIELRLNGLWVTIFTFPENSGLSTEVMVHDCQAKTSYVDVNGEVSDKVSYDIRFRK